MRHQFIHLVTIFVSVAFLGCQVVACQPWPGANKVSDNERRAVAAETSSRIQVTLDPPNAYDEAAPVLRISVESENGDFLDPEAFFLIKGSVGPAHLGQLARNKISKALSKRIVPALRWAPEVGQIMLAPLSILEAGETYALASGTPKMFRMIRVMDHDPLPVLHLWWPPNGISTGRRVGVWCGNVRLPATGAPGSSHTVVLQPTNETGIIRTGAIDRGRRCMRLEPDGPPPDPAAAVLAPPLLVDPAGKAIARLEPVALSIDETHIDDIIDPPLTSNKIQCASPQIAIGTGCGLVADDRIMLTGPEIPLLWSFHAPGLAQVIAATANDTFLVSPLLPERLVQLKIATMDLAGQTESLLLPIMTMPERAHLVINEVLANANGPEPEQEWVEIYNDGSADAWLGDYELRDIGGQTALPPLWLPGRTFALIVNADFNEHTDDDPAPPANCLLLRVGKLGRHGLSNQGEVLRLEDSHGQVVSRFPSTPKPKAGRSVLRVAPKALDISEASFRLSDGEPTPCRPNLPS